MLRYLGVLLALIAASVVAWSSKPYFSLERIVSANPCDVATCSDREADSRIRAQQTVSVLTGKRKNHLTWLPSSNRVLGSDAQIIVLGDSYADDIDMGFTCWPAQVASHFGISLLNVAHGGSVSKQARSQLATAVDFVQASDLRAKPEQTVLIIHTGGNDLLHALQNPILLALLVADLWKCMSAMKRRTFETLRFSFAEKVVDRIAQEMDSLLADVAKHGYTNVIVSDLPISTVIPLARLLIHLLTLGDSAVVTEILRSFAEAVHKRLSIALLASAKKYSINMQKFNEATLLEEIASDALANSSGVWDTLCLVGKQLRRQFRFADEPRKRFWLDGHHPGADAHAKLAKKAIAVVKSLEVV